MEGLERNRPPELAFDVAGDDGGTAIVTVRGDLDIANIERLELAVEPIIGATPDRLVVDVARIALCRQLGDRALGAMGDDRRRDRIARRLAAAADR